mgnify:CR=1 FL=1
MPVCWEATYNYNTLQFREARRPVGRRKFKSYADVVCAFDIETSRFKEIEQSVMYIWQFCLDFPDGHDVVLLGRTWQELKHMCMMLQRRLHGMSLKIWIHNASYEFQFLSGIYDFQPDEVFAMEPRQILDFSMYKHFEFFCSYKLFNMSLSAATAKYAPDYHKRDGREFGYDERRFSDTPLTRKELLYCVYDVWGLCKAIRGIMQLFGDDLYTIPRTSTGYVRREVKREMQPFHNYLVDRYPDYELYKLLRAAFRGGNTHASRFYAGEILHDVASVDISSSYPSQQCCKLYPVEKFRRSYDGRISYLHLCRERGRAALIHCRLTRVELLTPFVHIPYLPVAKCIYSRGVRADNGRILSAAEIEIVITDIDFEIIERQYKFDYEMLDLWLSWYGELPAPLVDINKRYFTAKTKLKGIPEQELYYFKSKALLNATFGMCVTYALKNPFEFNNEKKLLIPQEVEEQELLEEFYDSFASFLDYQIGVWITAYARMELQWAINLLGNKHDPNKSDLVYCDTDSVKYLNPEDHEEDMQKLNKKIEEIARFNGAYCTFEGKDYILGVYEDDGEYGRCHRYLHGRFARRRADGHEYGALPRAFGKIRQKRSYTLRSALCDRKYLGINSALSERTKINEAFGCIFTYCNGLIHGGLRPKRKNPKHHFDAH